MSKSDNTIYLMMYKQAVQELIDSGEGTQAHIDGMKTTNMAIKESVEELKQSPGWAKRFVNSFNKVFATGEG